MARQTMAVPAVNPGNLKAVVRTTVDVLINGLARTTNTRLGPSGRRFGKARSDDRHHTTNLPAPGGLF